MPSRPSQSSPADLPDPAVAAADAGAEPATAAAQRPPRDRRLAGILLRIGSSACFAAMSAGIKAASNHGVGVIELIFFRNALALVPILALVALLRDPGLLRTRRPGAHALRAAIGLTSMVFVFLSFTSLPLSEATAISFSMPLFATVLSALLLGEAVGRHRWSAVVVGFAGVLLLVRPSAGFALDTSALYGVAGALGAALVTIQVRRMTETESGITIAFYFTLNLAIAAGLALPFVWEAPPVAAWPALAAVGLFGGAAQVMMSMALRLAPVSTLVPFDYTQILFAGALAWLVFQELPTADTLLGGAVIVAAGLYIFWREARRHARPTPVAAAVEEN